MKFLLAISLIATLACTAWSFSVAEMENFSNQCLAESKVTQKEVEDFYMNDAKFNAAGPNLQCHVKCVMEKLGQFKNGAFDAEKAMNNHKEMPEKPDKKAMDPKIFTDCKNEKGANDCETAYKIKKCIRNGKPSP